MGILDNLLGGGQKQVSKYQKVLTENDFTTTDHQVLTSTTEWTTIATYAIPAQQRVRAGYGDPNHPEDEGRVYGYIRTGETTPAEITGKWRVIVTNKSETRMRVIQEFDEELTHGDLNDKAKMLPLGEQGPQLGEDDYVKIQFKPAAAHSTAGAGNDNVGWADTTESLLKIPITVYE